jgi:hypothetical protein
MSRLVRARRKAIDDLPEHLRCCEWYRNKAANVYEFSGLEFLIMIDGGQSKFPPCPHCLDVKPISKYGTIAEGDLEGLAIALESLDLDEGPITEGEQK